jgi:PIN domain nuclease of toxin-antitoxin system
MVFLDTHAIVFLYADQRKIPSAVWSFLDNDELYYSPMARLELDFLYEIGRLHEDPRALLSVLQRDYFLSVDESGWLRAAEAASTLSWTRDPFDRLITAHALIRGAPLLTRDENIRDHYRHAFWDAPP